jgi:hypothetical protein
LDSAQLAVRQYPSADLTMMPEAVISARRSRWRERGRTRGERPRTCCSGERCSDALVDGSLVAFGLGIGLDEGFIALGEFESDAGDSGGGGCSMVRTMRS